MPSYDSSVHSSVFKALLREAVSQLPDRNEEMDLSELLRLHSAHRMVCIKHGCFLSLGIRPLHCRVHCAVLIPSSRIKFIKDKLSS